MVKKIVTLHGPRPRPNANDGGLQPLWAALSGQSASPKLDVVFFPNCSQNAERFAPLHRQTKPLIQSKGLSTLFCCLGDTSTDLRYKRCCGLYVHTWLPIPFNKRDGQRRKCNHFEQTLIIVVPLTSGLYFITLFQLNKHNIFVIYLRRQIAFSLCDITQDDT